MRETEKSYKMKLDGGVGIPANSIRKGKMRMKEKRQRGSDLELTNRMATICHSVESVIIVIAYIMEVIKGARGIPYIVMISVFALGPNVLQIIFMKKNAETPMVKHLVGYGFALFYTVALFTTNSSLTFTYVIPMQLVVAVFQDYKFAAKTGIGTIILNIAWVVREALTNGIPKEQYAFYETQILMIIMFIVFSIYTSKMLWQLNSRKVEEAEGAKNQSDGLLQRVMKASGSMTDEIVQMAQDVDGLGEAIGHTKTSMTELSGGAADTAQAVQNQLSQTEAIQNKVGLVKDASDHIAGSMASTREAIEIGNRNIDRLMHQVSVTEQTNCQAAQELDALKDYMDQMYSIIEIINNITSETSLLSLNASIEAARAGEAGRGFAVVASEISGLADQTQQATVNIEGLIRNVSEALERVVRIVSDMIQQVEQQNISVNETADSFHRIEKNNDNVKLYSSKLTHIVSDLEQANREIMESIQTISAISQEVAAHSNTTADICEENQNTVEKVRQQSRHLKELAEGLQV